MFSFAGVVALLLLTIIIIITLSCIAGYRYRRRRVELPIERQPMIGRQNQNALQVDGDQN